MNYNFLLLPLLCLTAHAQPPSRWWTAADGLPTAEVQQMVPLPTGEVLVNCEGVFCLSNGKGFTTLPCNRTECLALPHFSQDYAHLWQGDTLLWLHDYYQAYLFDVCSRTFLYNYKAHTARKEVQRFLQGKTPNERLDYAWRMLLDSLGVGTRFTTAIRDWQQGIWLGTIGQGILYLPPSRPIARISQDAALIGRARSTTDSSGQLWHCRRDGLECVTDSTWMFYDQRNTPSLPHNWTTFICQLDPHRYLLCDSLCLLGYFLPEKREYRSLTERLPILQGFRRLVGACPIGKDRVLVYAQNGAFLLDTRRDSALAFPPADSIRRHASKYNCAILDRKGRLWIGTQNGLFLVHPKTMQTETIEGLSNHCIRSLVEDCHGEVWAGTSCGISRVTPSVINFGPEDGIPLRATMERAATALPDGRLVLAISSYEAVTFHPDSLLTAPAYRDSLRVTFTGMEVNGTSLPLGHTTQPLSTTYDRNCICLHFSALNYAMPSHTRYRYRLSPLEGEWQEVQDGGGECSAEYRALPPGEYTFEAQAALANGAWGKTSRLGIRVSPPWWLTAWAKTLAALAFVALAAVAARTYLRRKRMALERENDKRVNELFELREEARHNFAQQTHIDPQRITVGNEEQQLMEQMLRAVEEHLADADYGVDQLAADTCMSRSALYAKMRTMLGISPADFIRNVRLKRAAAMLAETDTPIGVIAEQCGYNTHKAFSSNFKRLFGMLPSQYREKGI